MNFVLIKLIFVILHVITAAAWFGLALRVASTGRLLIQVETSSARSVAAYGAQTIKLMGIFALLTFGFALGAFLFGGAFGAYGAPYHTSLLLFLILVVVQYTLISPSWKKMQHARLEGDVAGAPEQHRKKLSMGIGICHTLWLIVLILMFWPQVQLHL